MFRFSIREILWLTALAAVFAGWCMDHRHQVHRQEEKRFIWHMRALDICDYLKERTGDRVEWSNSELTIRSKDNQVQATYPTKDFAWSQDKIRSNWPHLRD
jgi:hypothetical protein